MVVPRMAAGGADLCGLFVEYSSFLVVVQHTNDCADLSRPGIDLAAELSFHAGNWISPGCSTVPLPAID
jgi:hypothetical protein